MINKQKLNNEIVAMRKLVRQAKVHVIHKLVRDVKQLRQRHGPENLKAKYIRKADRKGNEIIIIKKLNVDDVSKFALKNTENPTEKLSDPDTGIERRALFRIALHKSIADRVDLFRAQYPDWKDFISEIMDELGARRKKKPKESVKLGSRTDPREQKFPFNARHVENKEEVSESLPGKHATQRNNLVDSSVEENNEIEKPRSKVAVSEVKSSRMLSQWTVQDVEPLEVESEKTHPCESEKRSEISIKKEASNRRIKGNSSMRTGNVRSSTRNNGGLAEIRKFCEYMERSNHMPEKLENLRGNREGSCDDGVKVISPDKETVDPFFVKSDGKTEYVTSIVVQEEDEGNEYTKGSRPFGNEWTKGGRPFGNEWDPRDRESRNERGQPRIGRGPHNGDVQLNRGRRGKGDMGPRFGVRAESRGNEKSLKRNSNAPIEDERNLHPSWEAKRKQNEQGISNVVFQGKKIKFDDDDD